VNIAKQMAPTGNNKWISLHFAQISNYVQEWKTSKMWQKCNKM